MGPDGKDETSAERQARFVSDRYTLTSEHSVEAFLTSMACLSRVPKTKTIRPRAWSYWLKHIAENLPTSYPDGSVLGPKYVPNGLFIAAALASGFQCRSDHDVDGLVGPNGTFNMPYEVLQELDIEARPHGARAQARRRQQEQRALALRVRQLSRPA